MYFMKKLRKNQKEKPLLQRSGKLIGGFMCFYGTPRKKEEHPEPTVATI